MELHEALGRRRRLGCIPLRRGPDGREEHRHPPEAGCWPSQLLGHACPASRAVSLCSSVSPAVPHPHPPPCTCTHTRLLAACPLDPPRGPWLSGGRAQVHTRWSGKHQPRSSAGAGYVQQVWGLATFVRRTCPWAYPRPGSPRPGRGGVKLRRFLVQSGPSARPPPHGHGPLRSQRLTFVR